MLLTLVSDQLYFISISPLYLKVMKVFLKVFTFYKVYMKIFTFCKDVYWNTIKANNAKYIKIVKRNIHYH